MLELPGDYYTRRLTQAAFFVREFGTQGERDLYRRVGEAIFRALKKTLEEVEQQGKVCERFEVRFRRQENIDRFFQHLRRAHVESQILRKWQEGDFWVVEFVKIYRRSTDRLLERLLGRSFVD